VVVHRRRARLNEEYVGAADGLAEPAVRLTVGERLVLDRTEGCAQPISNLFGQLAIRGARKDERLPAPQQRPYPQAHVSSGRTDRGQRRRRDTPLRRDTRRDRDRAPVARALPRGHGGRGGQPRRQQKAPRIRQAIGGGGRQQRRDGRAARWHPATPLVTRGGTPESSPVPSREELRGHARARRWPRSGRRECRPRLRCVEDDATTLIGTPWTYRRFS